MAVVDAGEAARPADGPLLGAHVRGVAAFVLCRLLDAEMPGRLVFLREQVAAGRLHPAHLADVVQTWAAIRMAAHAWQQWRSAADGSTADLAATAPRSSKLEIDTNAAAALLGVTPNRVRQLARAGRLLGWRMGPVWLVDRMAVNLRRVRDQDGCLAIATESADTAATSASVERTVRSAALGAIHAELPSWLQLQRHPA